MRAFRVTGEIVKQSDRFEFFIDDDTLNFTPFQQGTLLARDGEYRYAVQHEVERIVFPNRHVSPGLRAGVMVVETPLAGLWDRA